MFPQREYSPAIHGQLLEAKLDESSSRATVFRWYQRFNEQRLSLKDDPRVGCPRSSTDDIHIHQIRQLIDAEPKQSIRILADATEISRESVRRILVEVLGLSKVCSVWVPYLLSKANMDSRVVCAQAIVEMIDKYSMAERLRCWATEDESWVFFNPHLTKAENKTWLAPDQKRPLVVRPQLTNRKALIILAFTDDRKFSVSPTAQRDNKCRGIY